MSRDERRRNASPPLPRTPPMGILQLAQRPFSNISADFESQTIVGVNNSKETSTALNSVPDPEMTDCTTTVEDAPHRLDPVLQERLHDTATVTATEKDIARLEDPRVLRDANVLRTTAAHQIRAELRQYYRVTQLDDVRVIRERSTGISRGFGFIRFPSVAAAREFLERCYPSIYLYGPASDNQDLHGSKVSIAFHREKEDKAPPQLGVAPKEWRCGNCDTLNFARRTECFTCSAPKSSGSDFIEGSALNEPTQFVNNGDSDVSIDSQPSQYLLFRGLEPGVSEELLSKGAAKLLRSNGSDGNTEEEATSTATDAKIASTSTAAQVGAREQSLRRILLVRDRLTRESWRYGFVEFATTEDAQAALAKYNGLDKFTISSRPVMVTYIHAGVFKPMLAPSAPGGKSFSFTASTNPSLKLAYWDDNAYASEFVVSGDDPAPADAKDSKAAAPERDQGKTKKRKAESSAATTQKELPAHLQFWTNRHHELHGIAPKASNNTSEATATATSEQTPAASTTAADDNKPLRTSPAPDAPANEPSRQSYIDPRRNCCLLCSRQFKGMAEANKHERLSDMHAQNLRNDELVAKALARLKKAGIDPVSDGEGGGEGDAKYRDRARERRAAQKNKQAKKAKDGTRASPPADNAGTNGTGAAAPPSQSKGAALLGKMGWTSGSGLGAAGQGMTAPLAQDLFAAGVGLGAEGSRLGDAAAEAERSTRARQGDFAEQTRRRARERFERME